MDITMKKIGLSMLLMLAVMSAQADVYQDPVTKVNYEYTPGGGTKPVSSNPLMRRATSPFFPNSASTGTNIP